MINLEQDIRDYRRRYAIHYQDVLLVSISEEHFRDMWGRVKPERKFYENGRRRITVLVVTEGGFGECLNILLPNPDDTSGTWKDSIRVTWQQIEDEEPPT